MAYAAAQSVPQLIPGGFELTSPLPLAAPVLLTVSTNRCSSNVAVTVLAALIVTVQVVPETVSHPPQPARVELPAALAVRIAVVPASYCWEQAVPQSIPGGLEVTLPVPVPACITRRIGRSLTVSVVLALAPAPSTAVIVVIPGFTPVARPVSSMAATALLPLVHVTPVPLIATGMEEPAVVPFPNWPQSFAPQHRAVPYPTSAQLWCHHPLVTALPYAIPATGTGVDELLVVPSPSWPNPFCPQHCTVPSRRSAQVCAHPALTATAFVIPTTRAGGDDEDDGMAVPSPTCPS
jgi:hypothetical protein